MTLVGTIQLSDNTTTLAIHQNSQNALKGIAWNGTGAAMTLGAVAATGATVLAVGASVLGAAGMLTNDYSRNSFGAVGVPALMLLSTTAVIADYAAIKLTGYCFSNAIHHLGPTYTITKL